MDVGHFLEEIRQHHQYANQLVHVEEIPARTGRFASLSEPLAPTIQIALQQLGIDQLYTHQVTALEAARAGQDFVVVTGTASGKTLCYHLPVLDACLANEHARALLLFPTKALAQDQFKGLLQLASAEPTLQQSVRPGVYDGDTPPAQRKRIKSEANLVLSNPDMLHASILPYHPKWARFFSELRYVVVDEVHAYRGILGANVACVLRRLRRICQHYGADPVFIAASATIANPGELATKLIGREVAVIDDDGSPRGRKYFALWNPIALGDDSLARRSATDDAVWLFSEALAAGGQCLAFTRTRQSAELVYRYTQDELRQHRHHDLAESVRAYRGGYLPEERRQIEQDLFSGRLRGVASTNALELGIDVGSLDVTLLLNYPGTIASTWQQAGRSGRRQDESLSVLLAGNDPVDQYLLRHPDYFFQQSPERAVVDPENPYVLTNHLQAAAFELPLSESDVSTFGDLAPTIANVLADARTLSPIDGRFYWSGGNNPAAGVSLRHMSQDTFSIILLRDSAVPRVPHRLPRRPQDRLPHRHPENQIVESPREELAQHSEVIANVDAISAPELIYPQAVYLHNGESYFVRSLDLDGKVAYVERHEMDYYTQAILESQVTVTERHSSSDALPTATLEYCDVDVRWKTVAFKKIKFSTRENVGFGSVDIPAQTLPTTAFALTPNDDIRAAIKAQSLRPSEALCGIRNLAVVALPVVAMCDSRDTSGVVDTKNFGVSCMILYDRYPGGLGYAERGYDSIRELLSICLDMVDQCPCVEGCPSCVGLPNLRPAIHSDPDLTRGYPIPDKQAALAMLRMLLQEPVVKCQLHDAAAMIVH